MKSSMKYLKIKVVGESGILIEAQHIHLKTSWINVAELDQRSGKAFLVVREHKFLQTQFILSSAKSCNLLVFDENGQFVSVRVYVNYTNAPFSILISEPWVLILPLDSHLLDSKIQSMEIKTFEQLDDEIFEESHLLQAYLSNMRRAAENKEEFLDRINGEDVFFMRKSFGMYSQFNFIVKDISNELITIETTTLRKDLDPHRMILSVRNGLLNFYKDILPIPKCLFKHYSGDDKNPLFEKELSFWVSERSELKSNSILIEDVAGPIRTKLKPVYESYLNKLKGNHK